MQRKIILPLIIIVTCCSTANITSIEINNGISIAAAYPHDAGIETDPDFLFVEKFENGLPEILSRYTDVKNSEGMSLVPDVPT